MKNRYHIITENPHNAINILNDKGYDQLRDSGQDSNSIIVDTATQTFWWATETEIENSKKIAQERHSQNITNINSNQLIEL